MDYILQFVSAYGLETLITGIGITLLTGIVKTPIKKCAAKLKDSGKLTRFIVFLPLILGFGLTSLFTAVFRGKWVFDDAFLTLWLSATSLSLAIYAMAEKFFPSSVKTMTKAEVDQNREMIENIRQAVLPDEIPTVLPDEVQAALPAESAQEADAQGKPLRKKIILRGNADVKVDE